MSCLKYKFTAISVPPGKCVQTCLDVCLKYKLDRLDYQLGSGPFSPDEPRPYLDGPFVPHQVQANSHFNSAWNVHTNICLDVCDTMGSHPVAAREVYHVGRCRM